MESHLNKYGQPVGSPLAGWQGAKSPQAIVLRGQYCRLEPVNASRHAKALYDAHQQSPDARHWSYLPYGPFHSYEDYRDFLGDLAQSKDPLHYAVIDLSTEVALGTVALMRMDTTNGVIEVGHVVYSPAMQRTRLSTEVMYLLLNYVFSDLGYRRLEWKCDALNAPSRAAAERFGFRFEGTFRQLQVTRGRNRDTAWHSIIDSEYAALTSAYKSWLSVSNFDEAGNQILKLADCMK